MGVGVWLPVSLSAAPGARSGEGFKEGAAPSDPEPTGGKERENTNQDGHTGCRGQELPPRSQEGRHVEATYVAPGCGPREPEGQTIGISKALLGCLQGAGGDKDPASEPQ